MLPRSLTPSCVLCAHSCACHSAPAFPPVAPAVEAMRLYVRTLEEEVPAWWAQHTAGGAGAGAGDTPAANGVPPPSARAPAAAPPPPPPPVPAPKTRSVAEVVVEGSWVSPYISSDKRPPPRYEHATALIGSELYVVGGNYGALALQGGGAWRCCGGG